MVGQTISQYQILQHLGAGGMGDIFKAQDSKLNRSVAIKVLSAGASGEAESRRRFIQEAQAASSLNHPNIITIHDIVSRGDDQFIVMEFVNGQTLADLIPLGGLSAPATLQYAVQIADGLSAAHAAGIIHRDLKPGNVMVTPQGLVKILDFGLAKLTAPPDAISGSAATLVSGPAPMTVQGSIVGTVNYMSPEQAQAGNVDARSDIFAFGSVLYEMVTGQRAFQGESPMLTLTSILRDEPRPVLELAPGVPPLLVQVIQRALRKDPRQRWQSMQEIYGVLMTMKQRLDSAVLDRPQAPARKPKLLWGAIAALAIVMLAGLWWWTSHRAGRSRLPAQPAVQAQSPNAPPKPSAFSAPVLLNEAILDMATNHVPDSVIVSHIRSSHTNFNLSTGEIIRLSKGGVSEAVIQAMRDPKGGATVASGPLSSTGAPGAATGAPGAAAPAGASVQSRTLPIIAGVPFDMTLRDEVAADCKPGQVLTFLVSKNVTSGDSIVVAKGAVVTGVVIEAAKKKFLVHTSRPTFKLQTVAAVDGSALKVRATRLGDSRRDPAFEPPGGLKSKDAAVPAGTSFVAYFDGDQTVTVPR